MQLVISALLHPDAITLVLSPLKRLQNTTVEELSKFRGVRAVAVNSDMHHDFAEWTSIKNGDRNLILTEVERQGESRGERTPADVAGDSDGDVVGM
ncbi:hypothetical protein FA95DRAFT_1678799 [Auriscalpium vulgare]|uniref:Uncharacterized protein n=1 Tax=Auriscalpium vulgare TaxID=40419 RepID=A0ACB8RW14_9AGAM|nr:hypothetical protein FA95DRAFT_1678799 [Auriscalpium vulgare]